MKTSKDRKIQYFNAIFNCEIADELADISPIPSRFVRLLRGFFELFVNNITIKMNDVNIYIVMVLTDALREDALAEVLKDVNASKSVRVEQEVLPIAPLVAPTLAKGGSQSVVANRPLDVCFLMFLLLPLD